MDCLAMMDTSGADPENPNLVLAKFENGTLVNPNSLNNVEFLTNQIPKTSKSFKRKFLVVETERMQYVGNNFGCDSIKVQRICQHFVGVINKNAKTVKLLNCEWFTLKPSVASMAVKSESGDLKSYRDERDELNLAYGSWKTKRNVELKRKQRVDAEDLKVSIKKVLKDAEITVEETHLNPVPADEGLHDLIPPINWDATTLNDVYNVKDIITKGELLLLEDLATTFFLANLELIEEWKSEKRFSNFVLDYLYETIKNGGKLDKEKCRLLTYLHFLIIMLNFKGRDFQRKDPFPDIVPAPLKQILSSAFMESTMDNSSKPLKVMTNKQKDKVVARVIILALIVSDFTARANTLMADTKCNPKRFKPLVHTVGAQLKKKDSDYVVTLHLPLVRIQEKKRPFGRRSK